MATAKTSGTDGLYKAGCICFAFCIRTCQCGDDEDCAYYDGGRKDHTSYLDCRGHGCCGEFNDRYCCFGPLLIVGAVFGSIIGVLIIVVIVGVCCQNYKERIKLRNRINILAADDIPRPSPVSAPPVRKSSRVRPPLFASQPFRAVTRADSLDATHHPPPSNIHLPSVVASRHR